MIIASLATVWATWWLINLIKSYDASRHSAIGLVVAFVVIGIFPIFLFTVILRWQS